MCANEREHPLRGAIVAVKEFLGGSEQSLHRLKEFAMRDFTTKVSPEHFNRVKPRTVSRQVEQHQPSRRATHHGFDFIVFMSVGVVPGDVDGASGVLVNQGLQQFGDFATAFSFLEQHHRVTSVVINGPQTIVLLGHAGGRDHNLLAHRAPQGAQGWQPTQVEFVGVVEGVTFF